MTENIKTIKTLLFSLGLILSISTVAKAHRNDQDARIFDTLGISNWEEAMARLDNYVIRLQEEINVTGVVYVYGGQNRRRGEPQAWVNCIKDYLVIRRGLNAARIIVSHIGYRQSFSVEMWITTRKGEQPLITVSPTVKAKDVRFRRGRIKKWRSLCNI